MRNAALLLCGTLLVSVSALPSPASADRQKAQRLFEEGTQRYADGKYESAVSSFQAGFREEPLPDFLYNIAMAHQRMRHPDQAVRYLEMYQLLTQDPRERTQARNQIAKIQKERGSSDGGDGGDGSGGPFDFSGPGESRPIHKRPLFWVALASGVVAVAAVTTAAVILTRKEDAVLRLEQVP
jgi:tetratricopeptide (TPR) repeat protein